MERFQSLPHHLLIRRPTHADLTLRRRYGLSRNPILVTALNPIIGYEKAAEIAKQAYKEGRPVIDVAAEQTELSIKELQQLLDPAKLTESNI